MPAEERPEEMGRVSLRMPSELIDAIDERIESGEYPSRSAAIRDGLREFTGENTQNE